MIRLIKLAANALLLLLITFPVVVNAQKQHIPSVDVKQVTVNGIRLTSREAEIIKKLGNPKKIVNHGENEIVGGTGKSLLALFFD